MVDAGDGVPVTFTELARRVEQVAGLLDDYCVPAGGRVAVHADTCQRYAWLYAAIPAAGRVIVPLNTRYTATELGAAWQDCSPSLLFTDRPAEATAAGLATRLLPIDQQLDALLDAAAVPRFTTVRESEIAAIFYTGGTTDRAKGVALTHRNKLADAQSLIIELSLAPDDVWLVMSPMFHAAGSFNVLPCVWRGALQIFLPRFAPPAVLAAVERFEVSITFGVPTMLDALAEAQLDSRRDVSSLRLIGHGGAPLVGRTLERVCVAFPDAEVCAQYGATEMAPLATVGRHQERTLGASTSRSAGSPVIGVDVSIQDPVSRQLLPAGEIGEIVVTGPNIMAGYWKKPELTASVLKDDSYFSGDLGYLDAQGRLYVVDRIKDMIISGGENVYSAEVEDVLNAHEAVREAAVIGLPDDRWGERVVAVVVPALDGDLAGLDDHARSQLAGYKVPRQYVILETALPRTAAGKIRKRQLRDQLTNPSKDHANSQPGG
jgi:long-chain acyl-CoA synthetase